MDISLEQPRTKYGKQPQKPGRRAPETSPALVRSKLTTALDVASGRKLAKKAMMLGSLAFTATSQIAEAMSKFREAFQTVVANQWEVPVEGFFQLGASFLLSWCPFCVVVGDQKAKPQF